MSLNLSQQGPSTMIFTNWAPLGRVGLVVAISVCLLVCLSDVPSKCIFLGLSLALRSHDQTPVERVGVSRMRDFFMKGPL